ncbi:MAG: hypothetical protein AAB466_02565 [Verrucomicrobiota bacterium]
MNSILPRFGRQTRNATKFLATENLEHLERDEKWLARATGALANLLEEDHRPQCGRLKWPRASG